MAESQIRKRLTRQDLLLIGLLLFIGAACFVAVRIFAGETGTVVHIIADGTSYGSYNLSDTATIPIKVDATVTNTLQIENGKAKMIEANCPDKLCIHQNAISKQGETIVCLPNRIVVEIKGNETSDLDSISR